MLPLAPEMDDGLVLEQRPECPSHDIDFSLDARGRHDKWLLAIEEGSANRASLPQEYPRARRSERLPFPSSPVLPRPHRAQIARKRRDPSPTRPRPGWLAELLDARRAPLRVPEPPSHERLWPASQEAPRGHAQFSPSYAAVGLTAYFWACAPSARGFCRSGLTAVRFDVMRGRLTGRNGEFFAGSACARPSSIFFAPQTASLEVIAVTCMHAIV